MVRQCGRFVHWFNLANIISWANSRYNLLDVLVLGHLFNLGSYNVSYDGYAKVMLQACHPSHTFIYSERGANVFAITSQMSFLAIDSVSFRFVLANICPSSFFCFSSISKWSYSWWGGSYGTRWKQVSWAGTSCYWVDTFKDVNFVNAPARVIGVFSCRTDFFPSDDWIILLSVF
jgi:hypothetical protein